MREAVSTGRCLHYNLQRLVKSLIKTHKAKSRKLDETSQDL